MINAAQAPSERLALGGIDGFVGIVHTSKEAVQGQQVHVGVDGEEPLHGALHGDFEEEEARAVWGRTLELKSAYREWITATSHDWANLIMVWDPNAGRPGILERTPSCMARLHLSSGSTDTLGPLCMLQRIGWI